MMRKGNEPREERVPSGLAVAVIGRRRWGVFWTLVDQAALSGGSFFATLGIGRSLGEEGLGIYYVGMPCLFIAMATLGSLIGVPYAVRRQAMDEHRREAWLGTALYAASIIGLGIFITLGLVSLGLTWAIGTGVGQLAGAISAAVVTAWFREFLRRVALAEFRPAATVLIDGTTAVIQIAGIFGLAVSEMLTVPLAFLVTALAHAAGVGVGVLIWRSRYRIEAAVLRQDLWEGWCFGRTSLLAALIAVVQGWSVPWLMVAFGTTLAVGRFAEALTIPLMINPLAMGLAAYLTPSYSRLLTESGVAGLWREMTRGMAILGLIATVFVGWVAFEGPWALERLFDHPVPNGTRITLILLSLSTVLARLVMLPVEAALLATERADVLSRSGMVSMLVTVVSVILGVVVADEVGAALGVTVGTLVCEGLKLWGMMTAASERGWGGRKNSSKGTDGLAATGESR